MGVVSDVNFIEEQLSVKFTNENETKIERYSWADIEPLNPEIAEKRCANCPGKGRGKNSDAREDDDIDEAGVDTEE